MPAPRRRRRKTTSSEVSRCSWCGAYSRLREHFRESGEPDRPKLLCPFCQDDRDLPELASVGMLCLLAVALGMYALDGEPPGLLWFVLIAAGLIGLHEAVHALAGYLAGATIYEIRIGMAGKRPLRFQVLGVRVTVGWNFIYGGGYCAGAFVSRPPTAWRIAVFVGSPMAVHLGCLMLAWPHLSWKHWTSWEYFGFWNTLLLARSAYPHRFRENGLTLDSDGRSMYRLFADREAIVREHWIQALIVAVAYARDASVQREILERTLAEHPDWEWLRGPIGRAYWTMGDHESALEYLKDIAEWEQSDSQLGEAHLAARGELVGDKGVRFLRGSLFLCADRVADAVAEYEAGLAAETVREARPIWQADLAFALLLQPDPPAKAIDLAEEAFRDLPWVPYVAITKAVALLETGDHRGALTKLATVDGYDPRDGFKPFVEAVRAIAYGRKGDHDRAQRALTAAGDVPFPALLRRAEAAFTP